MNLSNAFREVCNRRATHEAICVEAQDHLSGGKTPCERRFRIPFNGPVIPFGAMVEYHPISAKDLSRLHQFGPKVLPGMFLGYVLFARRCGKET